MSRSQRPPEFFIDRSLGWHRMPHALRERGWWVRTHHDVFGERDEDIRDVEWLELCGRRNLPALSRDARGDELPPGFSTAHGRRGWLREAERQLDRERAAKARPVPRSRQKGLREAKRQLDEELAVECRANAEYEHYRVRGRDSSGRRLGARPKPFEPPATPAGTINVTDPDSRRLKASPGFVQGYNAQLVTNAPPR